MPDAFANALKEFEDVVDAIGETREKLAALEEKRNRLRKQLRNLAGTTESPSATASGSAGISAISEIVDVVRALRGSAKLGDIAKKAGLESSVASTRLQRAVQMNQLVRVGHGQYQLPADELKALLSGSESSSTSTATSSSSSAE